MVLTMENKRNILVSIIIPFYNRSDLLINCVNSITKNTFNNYEIILIDDGSEEKHSSIAKKLISDNIYYYKLNKNYERGYARNFGANKSNGNYLNFFDSDDICLDNHVKETTNFIKKYNFPELFSHSHMLLSSKRLTKKKHIGILNKKINNNNCVSCNSIVIRKDIFLNNKFSENRLLSGSEDWDLWLRLSMNFNIYSNPIFTSIIIDHDDRSMRSQNLSTIIKRLDNLILRIQNKKIYNYQKLNLSKVFSEIYSFKSFTLSSNKSFKYESLKYLLKSIFFNYSKIYNKRSIVILKNLIKNFFISF